MTETVRPTVLVVEDDPALRKQIAWSLDAFECVQAHDRESALVAMRRHAPAVVTMDLGLPPEPAGVGEGMRLLGEILAGWPDTKVIVLTGQEERANALRAVERGAHDFFAKPFEPDKLRLTIEQAMRLHDLQRENRRLRETRQPEALAGVITRDPQMMRLCRMTEKVAGADASVMLVGESGTGKEVLARALHEASGRRAQRFVAINCAAIPGDLLESELFGHERGAFTGAVKTTPGKIELAHGGTLLLDEIGDLPLALQPKLLRFLQERTLERIGGRQEIPVDVRVVCATHKDPQALIREGSFREDLYYRLAEVVLHIPPLRDRVGDAVLLAHAFVRRFAHDHKRGAMVLSDDAVRAIERHAWPGNVRQLASCIKRAVIMAEGRQIGPEDIGLDHAGPEDSADGLHLRTAREHVERRTVTLAMAKSNGNVARAADLLGVSRPTLYDLMNRLNIK